VYLLLFFYYYFLPALAYSFPSYLVPKKSCLCRQSNKVTFPPPCSNSDAFLFFYFHSPPPPTLLRGVICITFNATDGCLVASLFAGRVHRRAWGHEVIALATEIFYFQTTSISVEFVSPVVKHLNSRGLHFSTAFSYILFLIV
jgi:hypothetical protein